MTRDYFREGGPFNARRTSPDHMSFDAPIKADEFGRIARECPSGGCSPGLFKVKFETGKTDEQEIAYCPYCRHAGEPNDFLSDKQEQYMGEILFNEVARATQEAMKNACRGSKNMSFEPGNLPYIHSPVEETVQRDVVCPHCGLDHAVYGLAVWCPDCGVDIFMTHVEAEFDVVRAMLGDVERRRENLGPRIGGSDLENCLEDTVSIFEAVLKAMLLRLFRESKRTEEEIETFFKKHAGNPFQNSRRAEEIIRKEMDQELFTGVPENEIKSLKETFEKRHPITHNLGVSDKKYQERATRAEREGKDIRVTKEEIEKAITLCMGVLASLHQRVFGPASEPGK